MTIALRATDPATGERPVPEAGGAVCTQLLEVVPVALLWIDRHGTVRQRNGRAQTLLQTPSLGVQWRDLVAQRFKTGATDAALMLTDGTPVTVTISPYAGGQLVALAVHGVTRAETERNERHARLAEIGKLAAGLAHQLRTPIAAAQVYLDLARETGNAAYLEETQIALDSLTRHTEGLLTLARGEMQRDACISSAELMEFTTRQARPLLRGCRLEVVNTWSQARLRCNQHLLAGVLLNLIDNAARASAPGGRIDMHCRRGSPAQGRPVIEIAVVDSGCGIAHEMCARLGEPLLTSRAQGTGLGLTMARLIAERHGGALRIESTPGAGTVVTIHLAAAD